MIIWTVSYLNINNDNTTIVSQSREELLDIEELFDMKVKQDINIPTLREYITKWL